MSSLPDFWLTCHYAPHQTLLLKLSLPSLPAMTGDLPEHSSNDVLVLAELLPSEARLAQSPGGQALQHLPHWADNCYHVRPTMGARSRIWAGL